MWLEKKWGVYEHQWRWWLRESSYKWGICLYFSDNQKGHMAHGFIVWTGTSLRVSTERNLSVVLPVSQEQACIEGGHSWATYLVVDDVLKRKVIPGDDNWYRWEWFASWLKEGSSLLEGFIQQSRNVSKHMTHSPIKRFSTNDPIFSS